MATERYKNLSGQSNVYAYELLDNQIIVQFGDRSVYTYCSDKVGSNNIAEMKKLATSGKGLNGFINRTPLVKKGYSKRERY
jgi:hypothetical protein